VLAPSVVGPGAASAGGTNGAGADPAATEAAARAGVGEGAEVAASATTAATQGSPFKQTDHGLVWVCSRCDTENALELTVCGVCGTTFADSIRPPAERPNRDPGTAALWSLFLPGAGHAYLGNWSQAIARGVLSLWVLLVVAAGILLDDVPGSGLLGAIFGVAAFGLWGIAAHDAYREARGEDAMVVLKGRAFLYLVLGLLGLLFVVILGAGFSARPR
jgi:hypothetical protein